MTSTFLKEIFLKAVLAVQPQNLIRNQVKLVNGHLLIKTETYPIRKPCYIIGFGKAVLGMALEMEKILDSHLHNGIVTVPEGIFNFFLKPNETKIKFVEGALNNLPDENAMIGAKKIKGLIETLTAEDLLIVLISGGGSALLPLPKSPVSLEEKLGLIKNLASKGADITELNCVRKQISILKGGGLAELAYPARVVSLILSDVVGDPLDYIASGPTVPNSDSPDKAVKILKKYLNQIPNNIQKILEQPSNRSKNYPHVHNLIIGNNKMATEAAKLEAESLGFQSVILSTTIEGDVMELAKFYADLVKTICTSTETDSFQNFTIESRLMTNFDNSKPICLIAAGEPTVKVKGNGKGGRNQHLALAFLVELKKLNLKTHDINFLSCGTDGMDGPTDAAGAIVDQNLLEDKIDEILGYLNENDSNTFFSNYNSGRNLVKTGHTGTNVMDIHLISIQAKNLKASL